MTTKIVIIIFSAYALLGCGSQQHHKQASSQGENMEKLASNNPASLIIYFGGDSSETFVPEEALPEAHAIIRELYENAEPIRLYLEDDVLDELLANATGFGLRFKPAMPLGSGTNNMSFILFLTEGNFSNTSSGANIFFLTAIDNDDLIRSPFMVEGGRDQYLKLRELLGI